METWLHRQLKQFNSESILLHKALVTKLIYIIKSAKVTGVHYRKCRKSRIKSKNVVFRVSAHFVTRS